MNLSFERGIASKYTSKSQIARILTEKWVQENAYCLSSVVSGVCLCCESHCMDGVAV
jgi:hypothetical protein